MLTNGKSKVFDLKITYLGQICDGYFCLMFAFAIQVWHSKVKTIILPHKTEYLERENFQNFCQKRK
jgi:hypothetical protein